MTQDNNSLEALINAKGLKVGNEVLGTDSLVTTPSANLTTDSSGKLAVVTTVSARQSTATSALFSISGKAVADVLTNTLVTGASVSTATKAGFVRVDVTSDDNTLTGGSYYLELFTLS